jgi:transaldolase
MTKPTNLKTKIFLDSGDPNETREAIQILGFLDGQTTNPTLISKNPVAKARLEKSDKFEPQEIFNFYKTVVSEISGLIPDGSVSIEVYSDKNTTADQMYNQALEMWTWIPNAHIKFPTSHAGLEAAHRFVIHNQGRANMTLCFNQEQGAAVYSATKGARKGDIFYSSFVGRLFDKGIDGITQLKNCVEMYRIQGDDHVDVLACSFRNLDQFLASLQAEVDIITVSLPLIKEWAARDFYIPQSEFVLDTTGLVKPEYKELNLDADWQSFDIENDLTIAGIDRFAMDWNALVK